MITATDVFSRLLFLLISATAFQPQKFDPSVFLAGAAARRVGAILIDAENTRGKSGFVLSHTDLLDSLETWTAMCNLTGKVTLVMDHGSEPSAFWLPDKGFSVCFSGNSRKADDVIATDAGEFFAKDHDVMVVTADRGLIRRCRKSSAKKRLQIMHPLKLLDDLDKIVAASANLTGSVLDDDVDKATNIQESDNAISSHLDEMDYEIKIGGELLEAEAMLRMRSGVNNKRRKKLKLKVQRLREKLAMNGPSMLKKVTDILSNGGRSEQLQGMSKEEQNALLARFEKVRRTANRKESTGDRVVLAEHLRRKLEEQYGSIVPSSLSSPAQAHVEYLVSKHSRRPPATDMLRLVVVSDTHGFEDDLASLPDGDVLLHLGDFAIDNGPLREGLEKFDKWLADQMHPEKIVLRGNHDPKKYLFAFSGAKYVTRPTTITIGDYSFALCPYISGGATNRCLPKACDVLASHVPPRNILDRCYTGANAGCHVLRRNVENMKGGPPTLWLCGHIHEARGVVRNVFCLEKETLVVNAANANSGIASCIEHGPVVLQLSPDENNRRAKRVEIVDMDSQYEFLNKKSTNFFESDVVVPGTRELLMAVDLGLKTGVSLYNEEGRLLRYEDFHFESAQHLKEGACRLLDEWEAEANGVLNATDSEEQWKVTRIAIEGASPPFRNAWKEVVNGHRLVLDVRPEEWRSDLLTKKESMSGESSKAAARLIARQLVADYGKVPHQGRFQTDSAESVLLGFHVARRLGWIQGEPAVKRYSNGNVVVPRS